MNTGRVIVDHLGKCYRRPGRNAPRTWREAVARPWRRSPSDELFWALKDVSFSLRDGEMLGVIGPNGAGKSTLLRLLGGVGRPSDGRAEVRGRIGALLDLGGGFVGDLTGRENTVLSGVVAGLTRDEVRARLPDILGFAEIEAAFDQPVRTYSSGMAMRLAFSVAIHTSPEVLLVDEFLSVGDLAFQAKCHARIRDLRQGGCTIILVTHDVAQVRETCDRALWLRDGRVAALAEPRKVTELYEAEMRTETLRRTPRPKSADASREGGLAPGRTRFGSLEVEITGVTLRPGTIIESGGPVEVEIRYHSPKRVSAPVFGVSISRDDGLVCLDTNTQSGRAPACDLHGRGSVCFQLERLELGAGRYFVNVGIFESKWSHAYDYHWQVYPLIVEGAAAHKGPLAPPCRWTLGPGRHAGPGGGGLGSGGFGAREGVSAHPPHPTAAT